MKPRFLIPLLVFVASISTASMLFLDTPPKSSIKRAVPESLIEIKWGEGSEAGTPAAAQ